VRDRLRRRPEDALAARPAPPGRPDPLALLRQAGNQATVRALARAPKAPSTTGDTAVIDGIGELPVIDFYVQQPNVLGLRLVSGQAHAALQRARDLGTPIASVVAKFGGHSATLRDAVVSGFTVHANTDGEPPLVEVEFTGAELEFK
jgi:hypothetical protein